MRQQEVYLLEAGIRAEYRVLYAPHSSLAYRKGAPKFRSRMAMAGVAFKGQAKIRARTLLEAAGEPLPNKPDGGLHHVFVERMVQQNREPPPTCPVSRGEWREGDERARVRRACLVRTEIHPKMGLKRSTDAAYRKYQEQSGIDSGKGYI